MPRTRLIHPEAPKDEAVASCSIWARHAWAYLPCHADREGRLPDKPFSLRLEIFPTDNVDMEAILAELARASLILRYEVDGRRWIQIRTFSKHQTPHQKEAKSVIPPCPQRAGPGQAPDEYRTSTGQVPDEPGASPAVSDPDPVSDQPPRAPAIPAPAAVVGGEPLDPTDDPGWADDTEPHEPWSNAERWRMAFAIRWCRRYGQVGYGNGSDSSAKTALEDQIIARLPRDALRTLWERRDDFFDAYLDDDDPRLTKGRHPFALFVARFSDYRPDVASRPKQAARSPYKRLA